MPIRPRSGRSTWRACIAAAVPGASTWVPSAALPSFRCIWAKASRSRGRIASIEPAGAFERASAQTGAGSVAGAGLGLDVADRGAEHDRLVRAGRRVGQAQRREQVLAQARVVRLLAQHLDEAAEHAEAGVVVGELLARREQLGDLVEHAEVLLDAVVAEAGVGEDVALEAGRCGTAAGAW